MLLVIDNYDSFVFNLVQALGSMGEEIRVFRNDAIDVEGLRALRPDGLVLSPGPGRPEDAGVTISAIRELSSRVPTLGVCLGHQAIATAFGGRVVRADERNAEVLLRSRMPARERLIVIVSGRRSQRDATWATASP